MALTNLIIIKWILRVFSFYKILLFDTVIIRGFVIHIELVGIAGMGGSVVLCATDQG